MGIKFKNFRNEIKFQIKKMANENKIYIFSIFYYTVNHIKGLSCHILMSIIYLMVHNSYFFTTFKSL